MLGRFPNIELYKFLRMSQEDTQLWRKFIREHGKDYKRFDYDLAVGQGEDPGPEFQENLRKDFIDLTRKRIDAVGYTNNTATIFEIKPRAGTSALGQLITYQTLFKQSHPTISKINLVLITEFINTDEKAIYLSNNIQIFIV